MGKQKTLLLAFACVATALISTSNVADAQSLQSWTATTSYPTALAGSGCSVVSGSVYCVGGFDSNYNSYDDFYYAQLGSAASAVSWTSGPAYPSAVDSASCVTGPSQTIYCVGGEEDDGQTVLNGVYYDRVSSSGTPSSWAATATYPQPTAATSCVTSSGYIYCVGGFDADGDEVSSTYYAPIGSNGLGSWVATTPYPKAVDSESCVLVSPNYIYCIAGEVEASGNPNSPINNVYYAQLSASGIGTWSSGPAYPASLAAPSCVNVGEIYCVGGFDKNGLSSSDVYYADLSTAGSGTWTSGTPYPIAIDTESCVPGPSDTIFCVGGVDSLSTGENNVSYAYFASLTGSTTSVSTTPEFPVSAVVPLILVGALAVVAVGLRRLA